MGVLLAQLSKIPTSEAMFLQIYQIVSGANDDEWESASIHLDQIRP